MPANKNAVTRYYIIDKLLANRYKNYSMGELLEKVNEELADMDIEPISIRTLQYDIKYIESGGPFLAEIEHYQIDVPSQKNPKLTVKKSCLRYADPSYSIFKKALTDDEKYLLGEAFTLLGQFDGLPSLEGLESLRKSLNVKADRQIVSFTKNPIENSTLLGELFTAISQQQVIELHYHTFDATDDEKTVCLHPYLLKEYNRRWYLFAAAKDGKLLNFALDRIDKVVPLPALKYKSYKGDLNERFEDIIGITLYDARPLQTILFWVSDESKEFVRTKPLHESQRWLRGEKEADLRQRYPELHGGYFFTIECIENYELLRELTSFGADLIVLSPDDIRNKIVEKIESMRRAYRKN